MVVVTIVTQKNGETVYFDQPIPKVHFMKLPSALEKNNPSGSISKLAAGHYGLDSLAIKNNRSVL